MSRVHGTRVAAAMIAMIVAMGIMPQGAGAKIVRSRVTNSHSHSHAHAPAACGAQAPETLAQAAGLVATRIYAGEVSSLEVQSDKREVEEYAPLLSALESGNQPAVEAAVKSLVYSGTHIVRLRVTQGSTLLADVGGPYILAPVAGVLRVKGHAVARYELSVQDDLGYVKLETRFIGAPLVLRIGLREVPVEGLVTPAPASIPEHGPVHYRRIAYQAFSFEAGAYPSGSLRISLLVPLPSGIAEESCAKVRSAEMGLVARRISQQFPLSPADFSTYVKLAQIDTGGLLYIRSGSRQLAGSTPRGPSRLPRSGSVKFRGASYEVSSFQAPSSVGTVQIYELVTT